MHASRLSAAVAALALAALPTAGHATTVTVVTDVCAGSLRWDFSPPLSEDAQTGSVTQTWSGVCGLAVAGATTTPPDAGEFHSLFGFDSTMTGGYSGDCALATVTVNGVAHLLVGGRLASERDLGVAAAGAGASVVTPDSPCPISSVSGDRVLSEAAVNVF